MSPSTTFKETPVVSGTATMSHCLYLSSVESSTKYRVEYGISYIVSTFIVTEHFYSSDFGEQVVKLGLKGMGCFLFVFPVSTEDLMHKQPDKHNFFTDPCKNLGECESSP